jgi:hypothetical protein
MKTVEDHLDAARADIQKKISQMPAKTADSVRRRHRHRTTAWLVTSGVVIAALIVGTTMLLPSDNREMADSRPTPTPSQPATSEPAPTPPSTNVLTEEQQEDLEQLEAERRAAQQRVAEMQQEFEDSQNVEPIAGYGDFSDFEYFYVNWYEVTRLQIQCLRDQGFAVEAIPPGDGIDFSNVAPEQSEEAERTLWACLAGLNLPEPTEPTDEQLAEHYNYLIQVKECVESEGYETTEPPSVDTYIATGGLWSPYDLVVHDDTIGMQEWNALNEACPQTPRDR